MKTTNSKPPETQTPIPRHEALLEYTLQTVIGIMMARGTILDRFDDEADQHLAAALVPLEALLRLAQDRNGIIRAPVANPVG